MINPLLLLLAFLLIFSAAGSNATPALTGGYGQVHLTPSADSPEEAEIALQIARRNDQSPNAVNSLAIFWSPSVRLELSVPIQVAVPPEEYYTGAVAISIRGDLASFKIGAGLLVAFKMSCEQSLLNKNGDFVYEERIPATTEVIVWRVIAWNEDDFLELPDVSLTVDKNGTISETFPRLSQKCSVATEPETGGVGTEGQDYDEAAAPSSRSVVKGTSRLVTSDLQLVAFGHADDYKLTAEFYRPLLTKSHQQSPQRCIGQCVPVLLALPPPSKGYEYGCRLNAGREAAEWWQCDWLGQQVDLPNTGPLGGILTRLRIATSLTSDPTSCIDVRHNGEAGKWFRYDNDTKAYVDFDESWSADDPDDLLHTAYRCVSANDGAALKEIYLDDGTELVNFCQTRIFTENSSSPAEHVVVGDDSKLHIKCQLVAYPIGCKGAQPCQEKVAFSIEPTSAVPGWQRVRSTGIVNVTEAAITGRSMFSMSMRFGLSSLDEITDSIEGIEGDYNVFLHFRNNVSYLAGHFSIKKSEEVDNTIAAIDSHEENVYNQERLQPDDLLPIMTGAEVPPSSRERTEEVPVTTTTMQARTFPPVTTTARPTTTTITTAIDTTTETVTEARTTMKVTVLSEAIIRQKDFSTVVVLSPSLGSTTEEPNAPEASLSMFSRPFTLKTRRIDPLTKVETTVNPNQIVDDNQAANDNKLEAELVPLPEIVLNKPKPTNWSKKPDELVISAAIALAEQYSHRQDGDFDVYSTPAPSSVLVKQHGGDNRIDSKISGEHLANSASRGTISKVMLSLQLLLASLIGSSVVTMPTFFYSRCFR